MLEDNWSDAITPYLIMDFALLVNNEQNWHNTIHMSTPRSIMEARDQKVRGFVYSHFIDLQRPPAISEIAAHLGLSRDRISESLSRLHSGHVLVLESSGEIRMAMPFSAVPTGFRVKANQRSWWANCAWDALGVPVLLKADADIEAACPDCSEPIAVQVRGSIVTGNAEIIHLEVPAAHFWDDIIHT